jgi:hypothetical protein
MPRAHTSSLTSAIITLCIGREQRLFAAHEDVLCHSPFFQSLCRDQFFQSTAKRIDLPDEEPEIFSSLLEYLYKGDYYPRLEFDKRRNSWNLEDAANGRGTAESTVYHASVNGPILKDTVIYVSHFFIKHIPSGSDLNSALPRSMGLKSSSVLLSASKVFNLASSAARS